MKSFSNIQQNPAKIKYFRAVKKQNNDLVYFINTTNTDDFYVCENSKHLVSEKHIYSEAELRLEGRFAFIRKRLIQ